MAKVFVAIPTGGSMRPELLPYFVNLIRNPKYSHHEINIAITTQGMTVPNRGKLVNQFLDSDNDWLLFLDADMVPPPNALDMIDNGVEVCSGVYYTWLKDILYPLVVEKSERKEDKGMYLPYTKPFPEDTHLIEVDAVGAGILLVHKSVFKKLKKPYFINLFDDDGQRTKGHDYLFCEKVKKAGYKVYVDTRVFCEHWKTIDLKRLHSWIFENFVKGSDEK